MSDSRKQIAERMCEQVDGTRQILLQVTPDLGGNTCYYPLPIKPLPIDADFCCHEIRAMLQAAMSEHAAAVLEDVADTLEADYGLWGDVGCAITRLRARAAQERER